MQTSSIYQFEFKTSELTIEWRRFKRELRDFLNRQNTKWLEREGTWFIFSENELVKDEIFFIWDDHFDDQREGIECGYTEYINHCS